MVQSGWATGLRASGETQRQYAGRQSDSLFCKALELDLLRIAATNKPSRLVVTFPLADRNHSRLRSPFAQVVTLRTTSADMPSVNRSEELSKVRGTLWLPPLRPAYVRRSSCVLAAKTESEGRRITNTTCPFRREILSHAKLRTKQG